MPARRTFNYRNVNGLKAMGLDSDFAGVLTGVNIFLLIGLRLRSAGLKRRFDRWVRPILREWAWQEWRGAEFFKAPEGRESFSVKLNFAVMFRDANLQLLVGR
jgi:hypothetical protein